MNRKFWFALAVALVLPFGLRCGRAVGASGATICVTFTAPPDYRAANDTTKYVVSGYELRYSTTAFDSTNFSSATALTAKAVPKAPGSAEVNCEITGLSFSTRYWIALRSHDAATDSTGAAAWNWSPLSNVIVRYTQDRIAPLAVKDLL